VRMVVLCYMGLLVVDWCLDHGRLLSVCAKVGILGISNLYVRNVLLFGNSFRVIVGDFLQDNLVSFSMSIIYGYGK